MAKPSFNFKFISRMGIFVSISVLAILGSILIVASKGLNFGTDFKGGTKLQYRFEKSVEESDVRRLLDPLNLGDFSVQKTGKPEENRLVIKIKKQENTEKISDQISQTLKNNLTANTSILEQEESVGPKAGADLRKKAQMAIIVSWILMLIYIGYRFDFAFAPGAIVALIHDVIITVGAFAITGREVGLTVVAALLTITGYSVNDTIVIYDRIRENIAKNEEIKSKQAKLSLRDVINLSINETLSRTIITNLTVFMVVILMFAFGEGEFQNFGFAMIVGAIAGTYSTIYVASPVYIWLKEYSERKAAKSTKKA